jgi:4-hydroxybenzoate polyprenyltransferase
MESILSSLIRHLVYGCFFIACCAGGISYATAIEAGLTIHWSLPLAIMGATLVHYNIHYLYQVNSQSKAPRMQWTFNHRAYMIGYASLGLLAMIPLLLRSQWSDLRLWVPVILLGLTYSFPLMPFRLKRWKDNGDLKWLFLSISWTLVTALVPLWYMQVPFGSSWGIVLLRLVLLLCLCLLFDMRDSEADRAYGVYTWPVKIGWRRAQRVCYGLALTYILLACLQWIMGGSVVILVAHLCTALMLSLVIYWARPHRSDLYYLVWVDGVMLIHFLALVLLHFKQLSLNFF